MNKIYNLLIILLLSKPAFGQNYEELVSTKSCDCISELEVITDLKQTLIQCIISSKNKIHANDEEQKYQRPNTVEAIRKNFKDVSDLLLKNCLSLRTKIAEQKKLDIYKLSPVVQANVHFRKGNEFKDKNDYQSAVKEYKKALKQDKDFVMAYDHLGVSYRLQNSFEKAIESYQKSLELFPEGDFALLNIAVIYSLIEDDRQALKYYTDLANFYPENPEGYYGIGKTNLLLGNNESALKNTLTSLIIYQTQKSDRITDSEKLLELIRIKMRKDGELDLFNNIMADFGVAYENNYAPTTDKPH